MHKFLLINVLFFVKNNIDVIFINIFVNITYTS